MFSFTTQKAMHHLLLLFLPMQSEIRNKHFLGWPEAEVDRKEIMRALRRSIT